jgi:NADH-quinone oxidoreductase subunit A
MSIQSVFAYGYIPTALIALLLLTIGLIYYIMRPKKSEVKNSRYEAGNLPRGIARGKIGFQYLGYLILFAAVEPIIILILILSPSLSVEYKKTMATILSSVAILFPVIIYGVSQAKNPESWRWK